ncbi:MAG: YbaB/EbfC family nucleoid-associated protein [Spirochaetaceae bacterium]|nr:YbaB/EbfC family nucleoid-associated protein [Spirochaetaceae bacterium]
MNPMDIMKNLQNLQSKMGEAQEKMKTLRADGASGGDLVKVTIDGTMEVVSMYIDPIAVDPRDVMMLEELVGAAFTDAVRKMREVLQREMSQLAGGMNIPQDFMGGQ